MSKLPSFSLLFWIGVLSIGVVGLLRLLNPVPLQKRRDDARTQGSDGGISSGDSGYRGDGDSGSDGGGGDGGGGGGGD
jgi:hypothetical protein